MRRLRGLTCARRAGVHPLPPRGTGQARSYVCHGEAVERRVRRRHLARHVADARAEGVRAESRLHGAPSSGGQRRADERQARHGVNVATGLAVARTAPRARFARPCRRRPPLGSASRPARGDDGERRPDARSRDAVCMRHTQPPPLHARPSGRPGPRLSPVWRYCADPVRRVARARGICEARRHAADLTLHHSGHGVRRWLVSGRDHS